MSHFEQTTSEAPAYREALPYLNGLEQDLGAMDYYVPLGLTVDSGGGSPARVLEPAVAVTKYQYILVPAAPGAGKTTLLKHLALEFCRRHNPSGPRGTIPIPVFSGAPLDAAVPLREHIGGVVQHYSAGENTPESASTWLEDALVEGRCVLLFDGPDEPSAKEGGVVRSALGVFMDAYPRCRIVLTARTLDYRGGGGGSWDWVPSGPRGFRVLEPEDFDQERIREFILNRLGPPGRRSAELLLHRLKHCPPLAGLAANPLMLSAIVAAYRGETDTQPPLGRVYGGVIRSLLERCPPPGTPGAGLTPEQKINLLTNLAFRNHVQQRRTMTTGEILGAIRSLLPGDKDGESEILEELWRRNYLLRRVSETTFDFPYLCFQEYFAALGLDDGWGGASGISPHLSKTWWEGPIVIYSGLCGDVGGVLEHIRKGMTNDIFYGPLLLSAQCVAEAGVMDVLPDHRMVNRLWRLYRESEFRLMREKASVLLARLRPPGIIGELVASLTDPAENVRQGAVDDLGLIGGVDEGPALMMVLLKDTAGAVRGSAATALGRIGLREAVPSLIKVLYGDADPVCRRKAAEALGMLGDPGGLPALLKTLVSDRDSVVRGAAAGAAGLVGGRGALAYLLRALENDANPGVRWRIVAALGKLGQTGAAPVGERLIRLLETDQDREVRESAAEALAHIGGDKATAALVGALRGDDAPGVRGSAAYALGIGGRGRAVRSLIKTLLEDENAEVRGRAAYALGKLKKNEAAPYLAAELKTHHHGLVRANALYALGKIGGAASLHFLVQVLTSEEEPLVRFRAAEVLAEIGTPNTIPALKRALGDGGKYYGWQVKEKAFEALEQISRRHQLRIAADQ